MAMAKKVSNGILRNQLNHHPSHYRDGGCYLREPHNAGCEQYVSLKNSWLVARERHQLGSSQRRQLEHEPPPPCGGGKCHPRVPHSSSKEQRISHYCSWSTVRAKASNSVIPESSTTAQMHGPYMTLITRSGRPSASRSVVETSCVSLAGGRLADVRAVTESDDREYTGSGVKVGGARWARRRI